MIFDLPIPHSGDRLSAARAAQLHREVRQNRILPSPGFKVIRGPNGTHITVDIPKRRPKDKPFPYEVRFSQDLDSGIGGWKIYLPTEHLLSYAGVDVETSDFTGVTQIQDSNGDDTAWYSFDDISLEDGHIWLQISKTSGTVTAEFVGDPEEGEEGGEGEEEEEPVRICIAEVSYTPPASAVPAKITISQSVVGALRVDNNGLEPDNISTERVSQEDSSYPGDPTVGKLQIKGWHTPSPVADQSLAAALLSQSTPSSSAPYIVAQDSNGALVYMPVGSLASDIGELLTPDDVSTELIPHDSSSGADNADEGELQIKGWKAGTPVSSQSLAAALSYSGESPSSLGHLVLRDTQGALKYLPIGTLLLVDISALDGVSLVTGTEWVGSPDYVIRVTKRTASVNNNVLTLGDPVVNDIPTTPLSDESSGGTST